MKKALSVILCLCMLCSCVILTGCEQKSTFQIITEAVQKTQALESMAAVMDMQVDMSMEGMSLSIPMTAEVKAAGLKSENPVSSTTVTTSFMGQEMKVDVYQEGNWAYVSMDGANYKMDLTEAEGENEYDYTDDMNNLIKALPEELLKDLELTKNEDGSLSITVLLSGEVFTQLYGDLVSDMNESAGIDITVETTIEDAAVSITVANGYISAYELSFSTKVDVESISAECDIKVGVHYTDPGTAVTVTPPDGYLEYEELPF